jgi:hypothetical protein
MVAAEAGQPIGMQHIMRAVQAEYRKLGRLIDPSISGRFPPTARRNA